MWNDLHAWDAKGRLEVQKRKPVGMLYNARSSPGSAMPGLTPFQRLPMANGLVCSVVVPPCSLTTGQQLIVASTESSFLPVFSGGTGTIPLGSCREPVGSWMLKPSGYYGISKRMKLVGILRTRICTKNLCRKGERMERQDRQPARGLCSPLARQWSFFPVLPAVARPESLVLVALNHHLQFKTFRRFMRRRFRCGSFER